jgi:hypothetical protein
VLTEPPIGAIGSEAAELDGDDGVVVDALEFAHGDGDEPDGVLTDGVDTDGVEVDAVEVDAVELDGVEVDGVELDGVEDDDVESDPVEVEGVETEGPDTEGVVPDAVEVPVADGVAAGTSGDTAQPEGSLTGSGVAVAVAAPDAVGDVASPTSVGAFSCVSAAPPPTVAGALSASLSSSFLSLASWAALAIPTLRLSSPPAAKAPSDLPFSDLSASSASSEGVSRRKKAVTSPPVGMIVTSSQPSADRSLSLVMRPSTS